MTNAAGHTMRWKPANALAMLAVALLVAGCGVDPGSNNASQAVASTDEWRDNYGGPGTEGWATATNQVEWVTLWASLGVEPPAVLGDGLVGIGVFLGLRNTGGFGITIDSQQDEDGTYVVRYSEVEPGPGAIVTMALTAPYVIWTIADPGLAIIVEKTTP